MSKVLPRKTFRSLETSGLLDCWIGGGREVESTENFSSYLGSAWDFRIPPLFHWLSTYPAGNWTFPLATRRRLFKFFGFVNRNFVEFLVELVVDFWVGENTKLQSIFRNDAMVSNSYTDKRIYWVNCIDNAPAFRLPTQGVPLSIFYQIRPKQKRHLNLQIGESTIN